jgi:hypothetical protein
VTSLARMSGARDVNGGEDRSSHDGMFGHSLEMFACNAGDSRPADAVRRWNEMIWDAVSDSHRSVQACSFRNRVTKSPPKVRNSIDFVQHQSEIRSASARTSAAIGIAHSLRQTIVSITTSAKSKRHE